MSVVARKRLMGGSGQDDAVLKALRHASGPLSAYQIIAALNGSISFAPPTVYRALDRLIAKGLVHKLQSLNAYVACTHDAHHEGAAFAICDDCGTVTEFSLPKVDKSLEQWSRSMKFSLNSAVVELRGTCQQCHGAARGRH